MDFLHFTSQGKKIDFTFHHFTPVENESVWDLHIVQAHVEKQPAGYIILSHLSDTTKHTQFNNLFDYFIYRNPILKTCLNEEKNSKLVLTQHLAQHFKMTYEWDNAQEKNQLTDEFIHQQYTFFMSHIQEKYKDEYKEFLSFYYLKPHVDLITVYGEMDTKHKNFTVWPFVKENREKNTHFRSQGIAQALYAVAGQWMQNMGMNLHASQTQTHEGQKMWDIMNSHPQFKIMMDSFWTHDTKNKLHTFEKTRQKLVVL